jgi:shikimate dehydrogenase
VSAPVKLAVLGDPLAFTLSPELHRAGLAALGLPGGSEALRVPRSRLGGTLERLAADGYRGVNLTHPLKRAALAHVTEASDAARRAASVNTVSFEPGRTRGDTTDGAGFVALLEELGVGIAGTRVVLLGAGGAARSLGLALLEAGAAPLTVWARRAGEASAAWEAIAGAHVTGWDSEEGRAALGGADVVVNATPLTGAEEPCAVGRIPRSARVVDLVYGTEVTPWVRAARAAGLEAVDGLGLLVFQARAALALWTGSEVPLAPLARAVGWPR